MKGCVYLVGAGCGGPELLTRRGAELLGGCDAVVYDDLIGEGLLALAPPEAQRLYMGKRAGRHSAAQEDICAALISLAGEGKRVVRLKGGDPFVFGRGGEELLALKAAGVPCEEVPGISSAIAIPALAGIPVTHRGVSQSVHIITGHTAGTPDGLPGYFDALARLPGTLVFLMGLGRLEEIARRLMAAGMDGSTPAAVVSGGNAPVPAAVRGTLAGLPRRVQAAGVQPPAVSVVGGVAALDLSPALPLTGVRVGLTGTGPLRQKLRLELEALGAGVFDALKIQAEDLPLDFDLDRLRAGGCWAVFTSGGGADSFFRRLDEKGMDLRALHGCKFAAIGPATAARLRAHGIRADLCPAEYTSQGLGEALLQRGEPGEDMFLFRSRQGSPVLPKLLAGRFHVEDIPLYEVRPGPAGGRDQLERADYLAFASAGGVERFLETYGAVPEGVVPVCIGPVTARALEEASGRPYLTASDISAGGIVQAIQAAHLDL